MAKEDIEKVVNPLLNDEEFRKEFLENREEVLNRYNLTESEKESLAGMDVNHLLELGKNFSEYAFAMAIESVTIKT